MALAPMAGEGYVHRRDARERDEAERNRACGGNPKEREGDARERCLSTWRGVFEPSVKVHRGDGAERNRACGGNPKEREGDARERNRTCVRPPKQDRRICQTDNLKEKAKKGDLYGKIIIYFRIGYRGTSR